MKRFLISVTAVTLAVMFLVKSGAITYEQTRNAKANLTIFGRVCTLDISKISDAAEQVGSVIRKGAELLPGFVNTAGRVFISLASEIGKKLDGFFPQKTRVLSGLV